MASSETSGLRMHFLWGMLVAYVVARVCQIDAGSLPSLLIVVLHVVPPALFAFAHGSVLYGAKGISVFALLCLGFGTLAESLSLRTGFPFGHYYFTDVMGPKLFQLPVLLALAYLGIGYAAWTLALLILGYVDKPICGKGVLALPLLASFIMLAWDLAMDPNWSTLDHAWVWKQGGAYFGVPISNFFGWFFTGYLYYQGFALYCNVNPISPAPSRSGFWLPAILIYAVCALGNLLAFEHPITPPVVIDAAGQQWLTSDILRCCVLVSVFVMAPFPLLAWLKVRKRPTKTPDFPAGALQ
jgi:uncharacterized membrane protein